MWRSFEGVASRRPTQLAIANEETASTYAALLVSADRLRRFLARGDRPLVVLALRSGPELTAAQLGVWGAEGIAAPLPDKATEREARAVMRLLAPDLVIVHDLSAQANIVRAIEPPCTILSLHGGSLGGGGGHRVLAPDDLAPPEPPLETARRSLPTDVRMVQLTSGTTGPPKALLLSNANLLTNVAGRAEPLAPLAGTSVFTPLPQAQAMGGAIVMEYLWWGITVHVANSFLPARVFASLRDGGCVEVAANPQYLRLLLRLHGVGSKQLPALRSFTIGCDATDGTLMAQLRGVFPRATVRLRYGLSESVGPLAEHTIGPDDAFEPGVAGRLVKGAAYAPGQGIGAGGEHELSISSPMTAIGQITSPGEWAPVTDEHGFLHTGDVGFLDDGGLLHLRGRVSSFLKVNGYRVSALEIELVLKSIPGIEEAVVIGVPDRESGQRIVAWVEAAPGLPSPTPEVLARRCRQELAAYKIPQRFVIVSAIPRTAVGKPDRARILTEIGLEHAHETTRATVA